MTTTPTHAEHLAQHRRLEGRAARYGLTIRPGGRDNRHLEVFHGTRRLGLIHGPYSLDDWTGPYSTPVSLHVDPELATGNRRRSVDFLNPLDALDLLAKYAHLDLAPAAEVCPVHEPGDPDCAPTFGAPCTGRTAGHPAGTVTEATPPGTLVKIGPRWPMSKRGTLDSAAARFLVGPAASAGERYLHTVAGEQLATVVPADWLELADDPPHPVTLLPVGTFPRLEAESRTYGHRALTATGAHLEAILARRTAILAELAHAGATEYARRAHAAALHRLAGAS